MKGQAKLLKRYLEKGYREEVSSYHKTKFIANKHLLSTKQKKEILGALQSGLGVVIKPTKTQSGGFLGTLLASIGIPMVLKALTGRGAPQMGSPPKRGRGAPRMGVYSPPPFIGTWDKQGGMGITKKRQPKKGKGLLLGPKSPFNNIPLLGAIL